MSSETEPTSSVILMDSAPLEATDLEVLPPGVQKVIQWWEKYEYRYTTGPFILPENSGSLGWIVLNNDRTSQQVRVTIFLCGILTVKAEALPGPLEFTLPAGTTTHNANKYPEGFVYEIQVETNSQVVFPYVAVWPGSIGLAIPGTGISAASFIREMA